jgi:protein tyrosine/serine phosphatase
MTSWSSKDTYEDAWGESRPILEGGGGIYVHCEHGHDRTGLVIALERVLPEHWSADQAHQEMMDLGHSRFLPRLDSFFWSKTDGGNDVPER